MRETRTKNRQQRWVSGRNGRKGNWKITGRLISKWLTGRLT